MPVFYIIQIYLGNVDTVPKFAHFVHAHGLACLMKKVYFVNDLPVPIKSTS